MNMGVGGILVAAALATGGGTAIGAEAGDAPRALFRSVDFVASGWLARGSGAEASAAELGAVRSRDVAVDMAALDAPVLRLEVFDGVVLTAVRDHAAQHAEGREWIGHLQGRAGTVTLVTRGGTLAGTITTAEATYAVRSRSDDVYSVQEIDTAALRVPEHDSLPMPASSASPVSANRTGPAATRALAVAAAAGEPSVIDLMVVYTPAARAAAGGTSAMQALIALGLTETNAAYANSGVLQGLRLVYTAEVGYVETGTLQSDLTRLTSPYDGVVDAVHTLRETFAADLVMLVVESATADGMAWTLNRSNAAPAEYAFSVVSRSGISPSYLFGHELGHNMGLLHARSDPNDGSGWDPYSYAYKDPAGTFRTIMALGCAGTPCPLIPHFSNPLVSYAGKPTGVDRSAPDSADGARTLNDTRTLVEAFRLPSVSISNSPELNHAVVNACFSLTLNPPSGQTVVVSYATFDGTAIAGSDYEAKTGTVTFSPGRTTQSVFVPLIEDADPEGPETFFVGLSNPVGARIVSPLGLMTINDNPSPQHVPMYRAYNPGTDYHFFTTDQPSHDFAVLVLRFRDESSPIPFYVLNASAPGSVPLFRMYNPNLGRHFYTATPADRDFLVTIGMTYELDEGFVYPTPEPGTTELFRLYNNNSGTHLFTADAGQKDAILDLFPGIWVQHTSVGYVFANP